LGLPRELAQPKGYADWNSLESDPYVLCTLQLSLKLFTETAETRLIIQGIPNVIDSVKKC